MTGPSIIVVGAGIVGASIAYHLAKAGARVTVVESAPRAGWGVTAQSFGWLNQVNVPTDAEDSAFDLRRRGVAEWHRLSDDLRGALPVDWPGALVWRATEAETEALAAYHEARDIAIIRMDTDAVAMREPRLKHPPPLAVLSRDEGAVDPVGATQTLILAAREHGAALRRSTRVDGLTTRGNQITGVRVGRWTLEADTVVLASGLGSLSLAESVGIRLPVRNSPAILLSLRGPPGLVRGIISCPEIEVRQTAGDTLLCAEDYIDASPENEPKELARRAAEVAREMFADAPDIFARSGRVGERPVSEDGPPLLGSHDAVTGLYVAIMHPGVILAPLAGRFAAEELVDGKAVDFVAQCRPDRPLA